MNSRLKEALLQGLVGRSEFEQKLIFKAWEDEAFRQELLTNPKAAYAREIGQQLPEGFAVEVIEKTPGTIKLVLPQNPSPVTAEGELTEEALEAVAGGTWITTVAAIADDRKQWIIAKN